MRAATTGGQREENRIGPSFLLVKNRGQMNASYLDGGPEGRGIHESVHEVGGIVKNTKAMPSKNRSCGAYAGGRPTG